MAGFGNFLTRFSIYFWGGIGLLIVALRHVLASGYSHRAGFMMLLGLALLAAAVTERKKNKLRAWRAELEHTSNKEKP